MLLSLLHFGALTAVWFLRLLNFPVVSAPSRIQIFEAKYHFQRGQQLLDKNKPEDSWRAFERCIKYSSDYLHFVSAAVCLNCGLGRTREATRLYQRSNEMRLAHIPPASAREYARFCLLDDFWHAHIGHTANIDYVVKLRALQGRDPHDTILYVAPHSKVANRFLLEQWKPHLRRVIDPRALPVPEEYVKHLAVNFYVPQIEGCGKHFFGNSPRGLIVAGLKKGGSLSFGLTRT